MKLKEKIEEFKAKKREEKLKIIVNKILLTIIICILGILIVGLFITKNKEGKTAGATVAGNGEITQTIYKTISNGLSEPIYTMGYYDWNKTTETREFSVGYMEVLVNNSWKKVASVKEVRSGYGTGVSFMYKDEEGGLMNKISTSIHPTDTGGIGWGSKMNTRVQISIIEDIKIKWDGVINYVGGRLTLYTEYEIPRILMIYANVNTLDIDGTMNYPNSFFESGYNSGYNDGYIKGTEETFNPIGMIINPVASFFSTPMFGSFAIGDFFTVAMFVSVALIFLKIFAGG